MRRFLLFLVLTGPLLAGTPLSEKHRKWLEQEVPYIISSLERKHFQDLEGDEARNRFIEEFWRRRDPDPSTEANEFRQEHLRRIRYANERFSNEGKPGWRTMRGRIYIIHGPPDDVTYAFGGMERTPIYNPTAILNPGGLPIPVVDVNVDLPESETWTYFHLEGMPSSRSYLSIIFAKMDPDPLYQLERIVKNVGSDQDIGPRTRRDQAVRRFTRQKSYLRNDYRIIYAGDPRFRTLDDLVTSIFSSYSPPIDPFPRLEVAARLARSSGDRLEELEARQRRIRELVDSRLFFAQLPLRVGFGFLRHWRGRVLVAVHGKVPAEEEGEKKETLEILTELRKPGAPRPTASLVEEMSPGGTSGESISYQSRLIVSPGPYRLRVIAADRQHRRLGIWERQIVVPVLDGNGFGAGQPLLCEKVVSRNDFQKKGSSRRRPGRLEGNHPLLLDDFVFFPVVGDTFRRGQQLTTLLEIYNPTLRSGHPEVEVIPSFFREGHPLRQIAGRRLDYLTDSRTHTIMYAFSIPLRSLDPGNYNFQVRIRDEPSGQIIRRSVRFQIR